MKAIWKLLCIISCIVIGISILFPYFSVSGLGVTVSRSLRDGSEWIYIVGIAAVALVLSAIGKYLSVFFLGIVSLALFFIENNSVTINLGKEIDALVRSMITNDIGYYCLLVGSIALIVFSVLGLAQKKR